MSEFGGKTNMPADAGQGTVPTSGPVAARRVHPLSWVVVVVGLAGLVFQAVQTEDPNPMILYFTVWSAFLSTVVWPFVDTTGSRVLRIAAQAGAVGNLMAGIVFWAVLFPPTGPGKELVTTLAKFILHGLLPLVVLVRLHARPRPALLTWPQELATVVYPVIYLATTLVLDGVFGIPSAYGFLQLRVGPSIWLNIAGLLVFWCLLVAVLHGTTRLGQKRPGVAHP